MPDDLEFFHSIVELGQIRTSARAIIFNRAGDHLLVEKNSGASEGYSNFLGGGLELGESLENCIRREVGEETNARVRRVEYRFVVENFITFRGDITHGLEHYFEVELDREDVRSKTHDLAYPWMPLKQLRQLDLRPAVVRDSIIDGTFHDIHHLVSRDDIN